MLFSLIVYSYNTEKSLRRCLDSIASQDFEEFELIIVEDGSTDGSAAVCDEYAERMNKAGRKAKAKVIRQKHNGLAAARNGGAEASTGDWLWFINGSDYIVPGALGTLKERMSFAEGELYGFQFLKEKGPSEDPERVIFRDNQETVTIKNEGDLRWNYTDRIFNYRDGWEAPCRLFNRDIVAQNGLRFLDSGDVYSEDICFLAEYMMYVNKATLFVNFLYVFGKAEEAQPAVAPETVLPGLFNLLENLYNRAVKAGKKQIKKEFGMICCSVLNNPIRNELSGLSEDKIAAEINEAVKKTGIGRHIKKAKKELILATKAGGTR